MKQIVRDISAYYLLGYNSSQAPADGKFHEIKVRVKRPGVQVRARKGYWALTAEETAMRAGAAQAARRRRRSRRRLPTSRHVHDVAPRVIRTWVGTSRGENGKTRVTFVWEPTPRAAGDPPRRTASSPRAWR